VVVVLGGGLAGRPIDAADVRAVRTAPDGQPGTGVWWALAEELAAPATGPRRVVLADHDPGLGYLSLCALDVD
jgi:4-hydroxymandelate oxidase